ncbi:hypothetical protein [Malaciobacter canalis]|uniref:hypothetical protein n=1 Tax=Malaciobacter canalis TaxID=1912871 RepID=UPI0013FE2C7D|nr:hypothetical protein [Malaciobacter canalis]QEE33375.1 hypothetical protein ACAN_1911 [Malaciobacter canalis]
MYLNSFEILLSVGGLIILGVAINGFVRWFVNRKNKKAEFSDVLERLKNGRNSSYSKS